MSIFDLSNRYAEVKAFYNLVFDHFDMKPHKHRSCEIMYVVSGECMIDFEKNHLALKEWEFIFIDQDVTHRLIVEKGKPCGIINVEFACSPSCGGLDLRELKQQFKAFGRFLDASKSYLVLNDTGNMNHALKDLVLALYNAKSDDKDYIVHVLLTRVLIELVLCAQNKMRSTAGAYAYTKKALKYIDENFDRDISVSDVARRAGVHQAYLQKLFRKQLGCGIMTYINDKRMEKAAVLLRNSSIAVTEIAFEVGFNSRQNFGYNFEKYYQISPSRYRMQNGFAEKS